MSEPIIELKNLSKIYKVYRHPLYQLLGLIHPSLAPQHAYVENPALVDISLSIPQGAKIGIVGRNGSGKSTLLKILSGRLQPTQGESHVRGKIGALLELGTGFHPDFSGRDNVLSSLSYMGIVGKEAQEKLEEIIDFSELEHFMDQPIRVYSAGMYMRLAFSVATCVHPEILLVDEVLSVGDAYFSNKSLERMRHLSSDEKTTILLVSHNIYSLPILCDTLIWLENGRVAAQGPVREILTRYELFIRDEEEKRLEIKNKNPISAVASSQSERMGSGEIRIEKVRFLDPLRQERHLFQRGETVGLSFEYHVKNLSQDHQAIFSVGISRADGLTVSTALFHAELKASQGSFEVSFPSFLFNKNTYYISILAYRELDLSGCKNKFYSINENLYDAHIRKYEFKVEGSLGIETAVLSHPFCVTASGGEKIELLNVVMPHENGRSDSGFYSEMQSEKNPEKIH